jgi:hypothetical protein
MLRNTTIMTTGVLLVLLSGCASTTFKSTWSDPQAEPIRFQRTLAVFMSPNEGVRRASEDRLVQLIGPARSAASYTLLSREDLEDKERAKEKVRAAGFDGAVVMRVIGERQEVTYEPPTYYRGYWGGYHARGWGTVYDPGYMRTDTIVSVETNVYSLAEDKLLWSGVSETFDPRDTVNMVNEIAEAAAKRMRERGLLPPKP